MTDIFLGTWTVPSGNNVEAYLRPYDGVFAHVDFRWDHVPEGEWAFTKEDLAYYRETILPEATQATLSHTKPTDVK